MECFQHTGENGHTRRCFRCFHTQHPLIRTAGAVFCCAFLLCSGISAQALDLDTSAHETMVEELSSRDLRLPEKKPDEAIVQVAPVPKKKVSLHVSDAPVAEVLRGLAEMTGENVIFSSHVKERVTASLDDVTPEEAMTSIMAACGLAGRKEGSTLIIFSAVTEKESGIFAKSYRLSYANAKEAAESLTDMVSKGKVSYNQSANTVLVSGTPAELMQVDALLRGMDIPEKQVKVEAEVIAVNKSSAKELGLDWNFKSLTGSADYDRDSWTEQHYVLGEDGNIKYDSDRNPKIRNIEKSGWDVTIPDGYAGISYGRAPGGHPYTFFFQANLNALVTKGKAKVLAKPHVVTMNGRKADILIGSRIPVIVEHMENGVKTTTTEYKDAGIKLTYTPIISADNEITADVEAEVSTPYLVPEMKAYRIITRSANTMVRLASGQLLAIGGLIDKEEGKTFRKVPILGDIPLLGKLFQSHGKSLEESEIIILIRADVIE